MGYYIVLHAPAAGSAKVVGLTSVSCAVQYAVHAYYHVVFHPPARRAFVRKFDHASIFLTIASIYTPFVYRAYEQTGQGWMLALLAVEWALALAGVANSIGGLVPNMKKLHRTLLYVAVAWTPVPAACFTFGWGAYRWVALGGLAYMSGRCHVCGPLAESDAWGVWVSRVDASVEHHCPYVDDEGADTSIFTVLMRG
jgi:hemolysin III